MTPEYVFEWHTFHAGLHSNEVCLAADGLPFLEEVLECTNTQGFALEIPFKEQDVHRWLSEERPEHMIHLASVAKRARAEVRVQGLNADELKQFDVAKQTELNSWVSTSALKPILRRQLSPEQIL